jgi:retron-type reverse transcriptase
MALPYVDRVVQHALCNVIEPLLNNGMIHDSYACRKNKGSQKGMLRAQEFIRKYGKGCWILKADVSKFFNSIDHRILKRILARKIKDRKALWLCYKYIDNNEAGIPIGNLTSQLYANIYLDQLDHYVKDMLGIKCYVRYMDDFMIVCETKKEAFALKEHLTQWVWNNLKLTLNAKTQVFPERQGINFLGYRVWFDYIKIRHTTVRRLKTKIKRFKRLRGKSKARVADIMPTLMSWLGLAKWGNCRTIEKRVIQLLNSKRPL